MQQSSVEIQQLRDQVKSLNQQRNELQEEICLLNQDLRDTQNRLEELHGKLEEEMDARADLDQRSEIYRDGI